MACGRQTPLEAAALLGVSPLPAIEHGPRAVRGARRRSGGDHQARGTDQKQGRTASHGAHSLAAWAGIRAGRAARSGLQGRWALGGGQRPAESGQQRGSSPGVQVVDAEGVVRLLTSLLGLGILVGGVFLVVRPFLTKEEPQKEDDSVLTGLQDPRLHRVVVLEDSELPDDVPRPGVDEDLLYVSVVIFYPGAARVPGVGTYRLERINGRPDGELGAIATFPEVDEDGAYVEAIFKVGGDFESAQIFRGPSLLAKKVSLD